MDDYRVLPNDNITSSLDTKGMLEEFGADQVHFLSETGTTIRPIRHGVLTCGPIPEGPELDYGYSNPLRISSHDIREYMSQMKPVIFRIKKKRNILLIRTKWFWRNNKKHIKNIGVPVGIILVVWGFLLHLL